MKKHILTTLTFSLVFLTIASAQTKDKFLDTIRLGIRYQSQEFHTLNQKLKGVDNCNCDEGLKLGERSLQGISASIYEPLTKRWSVGADLGGSFGYVMNDARVYKRRSYVQLRAESFYHFFDAKSKLRPYLSGSFQLNANPYRALFSTPLGAGLRYQLKRGGNIHVQTAYDRGFSRAMAKNLITNVGFNTPIFKRKPFGENAATSGLLNIENRAKESSYDDLAKAKSSQNTVNTSASPAIVQAPNSAPNTTPTATSPVLEQLVRVVYFDTDKNWLDKPETVRILNEVIAFMSKYKDTNVYLSGHTDSIQTEEYNLQLSKRRVEAVAARLMEMGVNEGRISTGYFGESKPVANNHYEAGRASNRRVEIVVK